MLCQGSTTGGRQAYLWIGTAEEVKGPGLGRARKVRPKEAQEDRGAKVCGDSSFGGHSR